MFLFCMSAMFLNFVIFFEDFLVKVLLHFMYLIYHIMFLFCMSAMFLNFVIFFWVFFVNILLHFMYWYVYSILKVDTVCQMVEIDQWKRAELGHGIWLLVHPSLAHQDHWNQIHKHRTSIVPSQFLDETEPSCIT